MTNKERAISFLKMAGLGQVRDAYEKYIAPDFIHHNLYFKGDRASLLQAMEDAHKRGPNKALEVKHALEDGDRVVTHSRVIRQGDEPDVTVMHMFRFKEGLVAELWDIGQLVQKDSPNENGAF